MVFWWMFIGWVGLLFVVVAHSLLKIQQTFQQLVATNPVFEKKMPHDNNTSTHLFHKCIVPNCTTGETGVIISYTRLLVFEQYFAVLNGNKTETCMTIFRHSIKWCSKLSLALHAWMKAVFRSRLVSVKGRTEAACTENKMFTIFSHELDEVKVYTVSLYTLWFCCLFWHVTDSIN